MEDFRRMIIKVSDVEGASATIPVSNDHTDGSWLVTDIYEGELFLNLIDNVLQTRTDAGIINLNPEATGGAWGDISGTLSNQIDLQNALNDKQDNLVSGTNIKTIAGTSILGSGDIPLDNDFTSLNDTPEDYTGSGGFAVQVNAGETGLEFVEGGGGGGGGQTFGFNFSANHGTNNTAFYYLFRSKSNGGMVGQLASASQWNPFYYVDLAMPSNSFLKNFTIRSVDTNNWESGLEIRMKIFKNKTTLEYDGDFVASSGSGQTGYITFDLTSSDTSFAEGDFIAIGFNCTGAMGGITATALFELI